MTTIHVSIDLSSDVLECLQKEALDRQVPVDQVVGDVLADYFDDMSEDEILESVRKGLEQALAGNYRPAVEALDEIEREHVTDADDR